LVRRKRFFAVRLADPFAIGAVLVDEEATGVTAHPAVMDWLSDDGPFILAVVGKVCAR
jgi:hypothetical protein